VVVVDDGGGVALEEALAPARERLDLSLVEVVHGGPAAARNAGVRRAQGRFLAFIDDDCLADRGWLRALERGLRADETRLVGGRTVNALPDNPYSSASQALLDFLYARLNAAPEDARFFASNNMALTRTRFEALGGFDPGFPGAGGEDRDLCDRQRHAGGRLVVASAAVVSHRHDLGLRSFVRQQFAYGRGARRFHERRAARWGHRARLEPPGFYVDLLRYPFRAFRGPQAWRIAALTLLAQVANAAGFLSGVRPASEAAVGHP
jgi:GT2 family glycosyltransferase